MFAARDQENLFHGHQAAAASKPLNQGSRQLAPKTPFKLPLNDENGGFGAGKGVLKTNGAGKNAFVTPMGPKSRAPLGAKTTNAKAKAFLTPAVPAKDDIGKTNKNSVSARKPKPKVAHAEMTKLEVLGDKGELEVPEIEYMPPRAKDLPDLPDDHQPLNLSMFETDNIFEGAMTYFATRPGPDGLSMLQHQKNRQEEQFARERAKDEALIQRDLDSMTLPCAHEPECPGIECRDNIQARKDAQEEYEKTIAIIDAEAAPKKPTKMQPAQHTGPSTIRTKAAAAALSQPKPRKPVSDPLKKPTEPTAKPLFGVSRIVRQKKRTPAPTNPSPMRHTASTVASRTTLGHAKGRAVSASLRRAANPPKKDSGFVPFEVRDTSVAPAEYFARYGEPPLGSDMWLTCWDLGILKDSSKRREEGSTDHLIHLDDLLIDEALDNFQLTLD